MAYNESLAQRIRSKSMGWPNLTEKKMFGGLGFLLNGNMCVGAWKDFLIARLGPDGGLWLRRKGVKEFDITGRAMKGWIMMAEEGWGDEKQFEACLKAARKFVKSLPGK